MTDLWEIKTTRKHWIQLFKKANDDWSVWYSAPRPYGLGDFTDIINGEGYPARDYPDLYWFGVVALDVTNVKLTVTHTINKDQRIEIDLVKETKTANGETYQIFEIKKSNDDKRRPVTIGNYAYWISMSKFRPKGEADPTKTYPSFQLTFTEAESNGGFKATWGVDIEDERF